MITDSYLRDEVGDRQEITSSMVGRAERKKGERYVGYSGLQSQYSNYLSGLAAQQGRTILGGDGASFGSLGSWFGGALGAAAQSSICPYCGK